MTPNYIKARIWKKKNVKSPLFISKIAPDNINPGEEVCFEISFFLKLFDEFFATTICSCNELSFNSRVTIKVQL